MKKTVYMAPEVSVMDIEMEEMIASSPGVGLSETEADNSDMLSRGRRGTWGNLWVGEE
ncbi:MAG: hypothetical protein IKK87_02570 [Bacteroidaceae bacterium]|nr:hypothetical protein [Bacteroidaceae bacterium]